MFFKTLSMHFFCYYFQVNKSIVISKTAFRINQSHTIALSQYSVSFSLQRIQRLSIALNHKRSRRGSNDGLLQGKDREIPLGYKPFGKKQTFQSFFFFLIRLLEFDRLDLAFFVIDHFSSSFVNRSLVFCLHFIFAILFDQIN